MTNIIVLIAIMIAAGVVLLVNKRLSAAGWRPGMNQDTGNRQQHMGRSCGGLTSKIQAVVYTNSLPVHLGLTPGDTRENLSGTTDSFVKLPVCRKLP
jgi:hypothetical protein